MPNLYRSSDEGLAAFMRWAGVTPWATVGEAIDEGVRQGWLAIVPAVGEVEAALAHAHRDLATCTQDGQRLATRLDEEEQRADELEGALRALVHPQPVRYTPTNHKAFCGHCLSSFGAWDGHRFQFEHEPDCPCWWRPRYCWLRKGQG